MSSHDLVEEPKILRRRYFFAYHDVNGIIFPFAWAEDDGLPVGGIPKPIDGCKWEITAEEFSRDLLELEKRYPIPLPSVESPSVNLKPT